MSIPPCFVPNEDAAALLDAVERRLTVDQDPGSWFRICESAGLVEIVMGKPALTADGHTALMRFEAKTGQ